MKTKYSFWTRIGLFCVILLFGCVQSENYKTGFELTQNNRWDDAIAYFEKAVQEDPGNQEYKDALIKSRQVSARGRYEKARQAASAAAEPTVPVLERISKDADAASKLDPNNKDIRSFSEGLKTKVATLQSRVKTLYGQAESDLQKEDWAAATAKLREVNKLYPGYEDAGNRLNKAEQEGAKILYQQGIALGKQEDWKMAASSFKAAMDINPKYYDVAKLYEAAKAKDTPDYFLKEADKAEKAQSWERAIQMYEKAGEYMPDSQALPKKLDGLRAKVAQIYLEDAVKLLKQGKLNAVAKKAEAVKNYVPDIQSDPIFRELVNNLCTKLFERGEKYGEKEMWGNALIWYQKVEALNPSFPGLFQKGIEVKDHINRRIKKSIAVFDFSSPSNNKDAGKIAANKLITYLHKNASGDLRIIERENLQSILREMQLGQTGLVDIKAAQTVGKMRGIDTFIMGDVLHFEARTTDSPSTSQVKVLVDEEEVRNPEFSDWLIMNPKPTPEDMKNAPPRTMKKRNYQFISYRQGSAKISALTEISYKLVDTSTGENVVTNTVSGKLIKEDKYQDAVSAASIPHDPLELPTEVEVLDELANAKIQEMGQSVLKNYQSLEVEYFNQGQQLQKRRSVEQAVEKYVDAVYDERSKGISTPITKNSLASIEQLILDK